MADEINLTDVFYMFAYTENEGDEPIMRRKDITIALKVKIYYV